MHAQYNSLHTKYIIFNIHTMSSILHYLLVFVTSLQWSTFIISGDKSHKRWPLLHYLGFKRQLGEFLGQLPRLKASMNYRHPCGPKLLWATK